MTCLKAEAEIIKPMDKQIYESRLDRHLSFKDTELPLWLSKLKKKVHIGRHKISSRRHLKAGQIDNSKILQIIKDLANKTELPILSIPEKSKSISNQLITKAMVNLLYIRGSRA